MAAPKILAKDDPANHKFKLVEESLKKNPELNKRHFAFHHAIPYFLLNYWEKEGWVKYGANKKHPWRTKIIPGASDE